MKRVLWLALFAVPLKMKAQQGEPEKGIQWISNLSWEQVKAKAKEENKFIFVDAYATWCGPCKRMDNEVYIDKEVGDVVNKKFISVKVQMDSTAKDDDRIKSWYPAVRVLNQYKIEGYPSFLFFSPEGKLVHRDIGFKKSEDFIQLVNDALRDPISEYENKAKQFKEGHLPYQDLPKLARDAWSKNEKKFATTIAVRYKNEYADGLDDADAFKKENLSFIAEFYSEMKLNSGDRYFKFFYNNPGLADSVINYVRFGRQLKLIHNVVKGVIKREEVTEKIYKDGRPIVDQKPNWRKILHTINNKYGQEYVDNLFPDEQIQFYRKAKDWKRYIKYVNSKIKKIPPKADGSLFGEQFGDAWQLNVYAWNLFEVCENKNYLRQGLHWIDLSLRLHESEQSIDTKANLLYKLGRVKEAIILEEKAAGLSKDNVETLNKMKAGVPTWPKEKQL